MFQNACTGSYNVSQVFAKWRVLTFTILSSSLVMQRDRQPFTLHFQAVLLAKFLSSLKWKPLRTSMRPPRLVGKKPEYCDRAVSSSSSSASKNTNSSTSWYHWLASPGMNRVHITDKELFKFSVHGPWLRHYTVSVGFGFNLLLILFYVYFPLWSEYTILDSISTTGINFLCFCLFCLLVFYICKRLHLIWHTTQRSAPHCH